MATKQRIISINEPWRLALPQDLAESMETVSRVTGIPLDQLIVETLKHNWEAIKSKKKRSFVDRIGALLSADLSYREIAEITGRGYYEVYYAAPNRPARCPRITAKLRRRIERLLAADKLSLRDIGQRLGIHHESVRRVRLAVQRHEPETARQHRCPTCGATITSPECLKCSLVAA